MQQEEQKQEQIEQERREQEGDDNHPSLSLRDIGLGGATFLAGSLFDMAFNGSPTCWFVGGALAIVAARHGGDLIDFVKDVLPKQSYTLPVLPHHTRKPELLSASIERDMLEIHSFEEVEKDEGTPLFPWCPPDQQLKLGMILRTGQRFDPPINTLLGKGMIIAGSQGAGKSNITGLCATDAGKCFMSVVVIDLKREFYTLIETVPNGIRAGHPSFADECNEGGYFPLTVENAPEFARLIMEGGFQAIIDVPSYNGNNDEVALVIAALLNALMDWSQQQREGDRLPCLVITDEAHNFLPQSMNISAMRMHAESFDALQSAYSRMINTGRSYGYTMIMATQRIANIAKWAIANLQVKVIMKHAEKNDLDRCEQEVGADIADRNVVKALPQGTGIVVGLTPEPVTVAFDKQPARHVSNTPSIERAHQRFRNRQRQAPMPEQRQPTPISRYQKPIETYRHSVPLQHEYEPLEELAPNPSRAQPVYSVPPMAPEPTHHPTQALSPQLKAALECYEPGISYRNLAEKLNARGVEIGKDRAGELLKELKARRLLES